MLTLRRALIGVPLAGVFTSSSLGWGVEGHKIVAKIAESELTPTAKATIASLLGDGVSLADVANWADDVRTLPAFKHTKPWHYMDAKDDETEITLADFPKDGCVAAAITAQLKILRDASQEDKRRAEALKFIIHFVGDAHQPLHAGFAADRGGNEIDVEFAGHEMNLHSLWDSGLIKHSGQTWNALAVDIQSAMAPDSKSAWIAEMSPLVWVNESLKLAITNAYAIPFDRQLGESYYESNMPVAKSRLAMAGIRLGRLLNDALGDETEVDTSGVMFVGSSKSDAYHYPSCKAVRMIAEKNLIQYDSAPKKKHLHEGCPWK